MSDYSSVILADSPVAYYRLDEAMGTLAYDATGNGHNALISGTYTRSQPGALATDPDTSTYFGASSTLQLPYQLNITTWSAISIEFWTNANGAFQHVVATCNGPTTTIYLNAQVVVPATTAPIEISQIFDWAGSYRACSLDEVAVYNTVLNSTQVSNHYTAGTTPPAQPGTPGGVRLLIGDVHYPTIRSDQIKIDRTANDPISTFSFVLQDDPSHIALSELQEVVFLDAGLIGNPAHNLLQNPVISPYTSNWTLTSSTGGTITQQNPGVQLSASNLTGTYNLSQLTNNGLIVAGQTYMLSCWIQSTLTNASQAFLMISYLNASGTVLASQNLTIFTSSPTQYSLSLQAPNGSVTAQVEFGIFPNNVTNGGSASFWNIQLEPMSFVSGTTQQYYPSPFCANGQTNCTLMPDGTSIRQFRLFGGYITKATAGNYIGNNRQWTVQVSSYAWLLQKQLLNDSFSNQTDSYILKFLINKYFPGQFNVSQIVTGATLDVFGYTYNGTMREAINNLSQNAGYYFYVDAYRAVSFQPPGYNLLAFQLSDSPDNMTSFPYYGYSLDIDGTQLGNAVLVTGATNISAVEYDPQSIGYYNQRTGGQGIFWRTVNDSTIASNAAARSRAIAELATYAYAQQIVHLTTNQHMIPGNSVLFSSRTDQILQQPLLIQKASVLLKGFTSLGTPYYEFQCDLGAWQPDAVSITVKLLRKQLTNANNIGTPTIGLLATENMTFTDTIVLTIVHGNPATYGMGTYGSSVYAASVPGVPTTTYGTGTYGDMTRGYN